jgi:isoleucyl-tRNA synthetase
MAESNDYKKTLNLPQTTFAMKGNLPQSEPKRLERWRQIDLYRKIREKSAGRPKFVTTGRRTPTVRFTSAMP